MKKGPLIFLGFLVITLFFILGMQYGKRVKTADEALQLLLTIAPTPSIIPADQSRTSPVKMLTSSTCGFTFLYPADLVPKITSSNSGSLINSQNDTIVSFSCNERPNTISEATASVTLSGVDGIEYSNEDMIIVEVDHPVQKLPLELRFPKDYRTLIEQTFNFIK